VENHFNLSVNLVILPKIITMKKILPLLLLIAVMSSLQTIDAQNVGDYRSSASGKWSDAATWQVFDGVNWISAVTPPSNLNGAINILSGDSVAVTDTVFADQVIIRSGAKLDIRNRFVLMNGAGTDLLANGNLGIEQAGRIDDDTLIGGSTIDYKAAELFTAGGISPTTTFDGVVPQTIDGPGYFQNIALDNPNNLTITGNQGFSGVNFINGKIIVTGNFLTSQYASGFTGQSATRFIDGNMVCIMYDASNIAFNLPIGKNGHYSPMVLKAQQDIGAETEISVSINDSAPPAHTLPASLDKVSTISYVTLSRNVSGGTITSASLQLSYDSTDGVTDPPNLRIAKSDTANTASWVNIGGVGSAVKKGTITSTVNFITMGDFVLANATGGSNTLPLRFISFTAALNKQAVALNWATAAEINTNYFNVERKDVNNNWKTVGSLQANKAVTANNYSFNDATVHAGTSYIYRIKELDKDGSAFYSNELLVRMPTTGIMTVTGMYPVPAKDVLNYFVSSGSNDALTITIVGISGKMVNTQHSSTNQSLQVAVKNLSNGIYFLTFTNERTGEKVVKKFVKM